MPPAKKRKMSPEKRRQYRKEYREKYPERWRIQRSIERARWGAKQREKKRALGILKPRGRPLGISRISHKEALVRGELWQGYFSPTSTANKLKKHGVAPGYVGSVKKKLREKEGIIFPKLRRGWPRGLPKPLKPASKAGRIREEVLRRRDAGEPIMPAAIFYKLKEHGVSYSDVRSEIHTLRQKGVIPSKHSRI